MTKIYFVRHAQPEHGWKDDKTRPLTQEGIFDAKQVLEFLKNKQIHEFYCSPYIRSLDTIKESANYFNKDIKIDERLRERESGTSAHNHEMIRRRWEDKDFHEECGESINMVQERNVSALMEILNKNADKSIVIGTHGTALSSILNYFDPKFDVDSFFRIIDWMPYILELEFDGTKLNSKAEHLYVYKEFDKK